jgi:hypothetical protein
LSPAGRAIPNGVQKATALAAALIIERPLSMFDTFDAFV